MASYTYLDSDKKVLECFNSLAQREITTVSVDIEGEFNLHHYGEHLCLVQIFDGEEFFLIDPSSVRMSLIKEFFENKSFKKIMYDCTGDRTLLFRKYGISINRVVDLMPAVDLLQFQRKSLGVILHDVLGLEQKPKKKFQKYNWMNRPIHPDALEYALDDVRYLFELRDQLMKRIQTENLQEEYDRKNQEVQSRKILLEHTPGVFKKERFKKMSPGGKEWFKKLFDLRDGYAETLDLPPNSVVSNEELFRLSTGQMNVHSIYFNRRMDRDTIRKIQKEFSQALLIN